MTKATELTQAGLEFLKRIEAKQNAIQCIGENGCRCSLCRFGNQVQFDLNNINETLFLLVLVEEKSIEKIARNVSSEIGNIVEYKDIVQEIYAAIYEKPYRIDKFEFFYMKIKHIAQDAVKTHVRRYKKFSKIFVKENYKVQNGFSLAKGSVAAAGEFNPLTKEYVQITDSLDYNRIELLDFKIGLIDKERTVLQCLFEGYTKREIDEKLGSRCDRILKRVREMYVEYMSKESNSLSRKDTVYQL